MPLDEGLFYLNNLYKIIPKIPEKIIIYMGFSLNFFIKKNEKVKISNETISMLLILIISIISKEMFNIDVKAIPNPEIIISAVTEGLKVSSIISIASLFFDFLIK